MADLENKNATDLKNVRKEKTEGSSWTGISDAESRTEQKNKIYILFI